MVASRRVFLALVAFTAGCQANMYDVIMPKYVPSACEHGCALWTAVSTNAPVHLFLQSRWIVTVDSPYLARDVFVVRRTEQKWVNDLWAHEASPADAGMACSMPARPTGIHANTAEKNASNWTELVYTSFAGPWCVCANTTGAIKDRLAYCMPPRGVPEQINLQLAKQDTVIASFVTYEAAPPGPGEHPVAMFGKSGQSVEHWQRVGGISHWLHDKVNDSSLIDVNRNYTFHFIKFPALEPGETYIYKVKGGAADAVAWSDTFTFRAPRTDIASGVPTRICMFGDMGISAYNSMGNLGADCAAGKCDAVVHMGDHAYNIGDANSHRGDAYMNGYEPVLASCPWVPIIGNHEVSDGDHYERYLNQTWGMSGTIPDGHQVGSIRKKSTTPLGHLLTLGTMYGSGFHGSPPSGTSSYFSLDIGLVHITALNLDQAGSESARAMMAKQMAWLEADLAAAAAPAQRAKVPWIILTSHFPIYHSAVGAHPDASAAYYEGDDAEGWATSGHEFVPAQDGELTVGELVASWKAQLEPLMMQYGVDIYDSGHVHDYESVWPVFNSTVCQTNYNNPVCPVHMTEGNGGVPGVADSFVVTRDCSAPKSAWYAPYCRTHATGAAYGRWIAHNASHLEYQHVQANGGNVTDGFVIVQESHGPHGGVSAK